MIFLPTQYLGSIEYYFLLSMKEDTFIERYETFPKQTTRNRCFIYTANGVHGISIPLKCRTNNQITKDIRICYDTRWQDIHWKAIESAYQKSAFFEYYSDSLFLFYHEKKYTFLIDFNEAIQDVVTNLIGLKNTPKYTAEYFHSYPNGKDYRKVFNKKTNQQVLIESALPQYFQVFQHKFGFISNLSILDLIFNLGTDTADFLASLAKLK